MFCFKCGNKLPEGALFCGSCGTRVQNAAPASQQAAPQAPVNAAPAPQQAAPQAPVNAAPAPQQAAPQAPVNAAPAPQQAAPQAPVNAAPAPQQAAPQAPVNAAPAPQQAAPQAPVNAAPAPQAPVNAAPAPQQMNPGVHYAQQVQQVNQYVQQPVNANTAAAQQAAQYAQQQIPVQQVPAQAVPQKEKKVKVKKAGKKFPVKWVVIGSIAAVVIAFGCVCFFSKTVRAAIMKATMSDEDYYRYVEKQSLKDGLYLFTENYDTLINNTLNLTDREITIKGEIELGDGYKDFAEDVEAATRVDMSWFTQAGGSFTFGIKDDLYNMAADFSINKQKIIDIDTIVDLLKGYVYANIPSISEKYLSIPVENFVRNTESMDEYVAVYKSIIKDMPTEQELNTIGEKYIDIIVDSLSNIKVTEDKTIKANKVSAECTMYTIKINDEDLLNIVKAILEQASIDNDLAALIKRLEKTEQIEKTMDYDRFLDYIEEGLAMIEDRLQKVDTSKGVYMNVFVDNAANVLGREFGEYNEDGLVKPDAGYKYVTVDGQYGFEAYADYSESRDNYMERLVSKGTVNGRKLSGKATAMKYDNEIGTLEFKDFNVSALKDGKLEVTFVQDLYSLIPQKMFKNVNLELGFDLSLKKGEVSVALVKDSTSIIKATGSISSGTGSSIKVPSNTIEAESQEDILTWVEQLNLKELLNNMKDAKLPDEVIDPLEAIIDLDIDDIPNAIGKLFGGKTYTSTSYYNEELEDALNAALRDLY